VISSITSLSEIHPSEVSSVVLFFYWSGFLFLLILHFLLNPVALGFRFGLVKVEATALALSQ
jgi:hypothetical protein